MVIGGCRGGNGGECEGRRWVTLSGSRMQAPVGAGPPWAPQAYESTRGWGHWSCEHFCLDFVWFVVSAVLTPLMAETWNISQNAPGKRLRHRAGRPRPTGFGLGERVNNDQLEPLVSSQSITSDQRCGGHGTADSHSTCSGMCTPPSLPAKRSSSSY